MLSIILPTIRPHLIKRSLFSIPLSARGVPHEVVVVADFAPFDTLLDGVQNGWVTWVTRSRRGVVDAANTGYRVADGKYVFLFNDESTLDEGALSLLYREAERDPYRILSPRHLPDFNFSYYGRQFVPFIFASKAMVDHLGGLLDPAYKGFYADPDFSLRAIKAGVPLHVEERAILRHCNAHDDAHHRAVNRWLEHDRAVFRQRWDHLGEFRDP